LGQTKDLKNGICYFSCFNAQNYGCAKDKETVIMDNTSAKVKLIQSWRYKTLTVIKRHKPLIFITS